MKGYFELFGKEIPYYGILFFLGLFIGVIFAIFRSTKYKLSKEDVLYSAIFASIGGIFGAKLLSILTSIPIIIEYKLSFIDVMRNGFVFYGGFLGGAAGLFVYLCIYKCPKLKFIDTFAVSVPLGHAIGRIGCFLSGCCYGIPYHGIGAFTYHQALNANTPLNVPLLPIQLIESGILFVIFVLLAILYRKTRKEGIATVAYLILYSTARFILEFFRGDKERGFFLNLATSQWISIVLFLSGIFLLFYLIKRKKE